MTLTLAEEYVKILINTIKKKLENKEYVDFEVNMLTSEYKSLEYELKSKILSKYAQRFYKKIMREIKEFLVAKANEIIQNIQYYFTFREIVSVVKEEANITQVAVEKFLENVKLGEDKYGFLRAQIEEIKEILKNRNLLNEKVEQKLKIGGE